MGKQFVDRREINALAQSPHVIRLQGEWDTARYPELLAFIRRVPKDASSILVDLTEASVVDSTTLGQLLLAKREWDRQGVPCATVTDNPNINRLMTIANVIERLNVFNDEEHALAFLATSSAHVSRPQLPASG